MINIRTRDENYVSYFMQNKIWFQFRFISIIKSINCLPKLKEWRGIKVKLKIIDFLSINLTVFIKKF